MPAIVKSVVDIASGIRLADGTSLWLRDVKNSTNAERSSWLLMGWLHIWRFGSRCPLAYGKRAAAPFRANADQANQPIDLATSRCYLAPMVQTYRLFALCCAGMLAACAQQSFQPSVPVQNPNVPQSVQQTHASAMVSSPAAAPTPGYQPEGGVIPLGGALYGTTARDASLFELTVAGQIRVIHQMLAMRYSTGKLVANSGVLYGDSLYGGTNNDGTAFGIDHSTGQIKMRYSFPPISSSNSGNYPVGSLLYYNGYLYGMTRQGGQVEMGVIYKIDPASGVETDLYNFQGSAARDGQSPTDGLIQLNGVMYGTTELGGVASGGGYGTIFKFDPSTKTETVLYRFKDGTDGALPGTNLTAVNGILYGSAVVGGTGSGSLFKVNPLTGKFTLLYDFHAGVDGAEPCSTLYYLNGKLWGTTITDGQHGHGTVFTLDPKTDQVSTIYSFAGGADASTACGDLTQLNGVLYGTSALGGTNGRGTVYQVNATTLAERVLYNF
jgi:uncharacterized repeat protein (TIGR03803 family)